jgi:hypothetical protein
MNCSKILDLAYEYSGSDLRTGRSEVMPFLNQIQVWLHTLICPDCSLKIEHLETSLSILREDFFPSSPELEDSIMAKVTLEEYQPETENIYAAPGGISTRGWIITGIIILVCLVTAFFGMDFKNLADETGGSFLLPVGITIGIVLTTYGALFIGSHLKELTERFGL